VCACEGVSSVFRPFHLGHLLVITRITPGSCRLPAWAGKSLGSFNTQGCGARGALEFN